MTGISPTGVLPAENLRLRPVLCAPGERCGRVPGDGSGSLPAACAGGASAQDPLYTCRLCSARASAPTRAAAGCSRQAQCRQPSPCTVRRPQATITGRRGSGRRPSAAGGHPRGTSSTRTAVLHLALWPVQVASAARTRQREQGESGSLHQSNKRL